MLETLEARLDALGGRLERGIRVRELIMRAERCVGIVATRGDETHRFASRAVVLADGGFQANPELLRRFITKHSERLLQRNARTGNGDGLLMAEAVGALLTDMGSFYGHVQSRDAMHNALLWPYPTIDFTIAAGIVVDREAKRFTDEGLAGVGVANAIARLDDPLGAVAIFDEAIWRESGKTYVMSANPFLLEAGGTLFHGDTIEGVAVAAGLPPRALANTVAQHNAAVAARSLDRLDPCRSDDIGHIWGSKAMPIAMPPFYAVPLCAGITYTMGGVAVDPEARVLHRNGYPIEGLYAAGGTIGGLEGGPITGYCGGLAKALTFGKIAGESIGRALIER
jgi:succinate dehydrogenase/fumarate reductase flavoprotein subunit